MPPRATPGEFPRRTTLRPRLGVGPVLVGLLQAAPELADGPGQRRTHARQPLWAEDQEGDREEKDQFRETDVGQHPVPPSSIMSRAAVKDTSKAKSARRRRSSPADLDGRAQRGGRGAGAGAGL